MADDPADPNPTDPNPAPAPEPKPSPAPAADPSPAPKASGDPAPAPASKPGAISDPAPEPKPDPAADKGELQKLRETLAGGDEKLLKELERYKSVDSLAKMVREARVAARNAGKPMQLGDKPTEDEVKAFREANGIPEEAEAYPVSFREDYKPSEADTEILGNFKAAMHERNVPPAAAAAALDWYQDFAQEQQQALDANLANVAKKTQADLRAEMGGEFEGTMGAVREFMTAQLGKDGFDEMMGLRLMDGSRLQDNPAFVKMMAQVSTDYYGSNAIYNGDIETTSKTVQERINELLKLRTEKPEEYKSDAVQAEITKLYAQRDKINARK